MAIKLDSLTGVRDEMGQDKLGCRVPHLKQKTPGVVPAGGEGFTNSIAPIPGLPRSAVADYAERS
jgi:hypothetical protein